MQCELCQQEAVGACRACGAAYCASHAPSFCFRCAVAIGADAYGKGNLNTAVVSGDKTPRPSGKGYLQCTASGRPTVYLEDSGPPACYQCGALARRVCRNCQALFCPDHAGGADVCAGCARSSRLGLFILLGLGLVFGLLLIWSQLAGGP
jgi:hypothetical protein